MYSFVVCSFDSFLFVFVCIHLFALRLFSCFILFLIAFLDLSLFSLLSSACLLTILFVCIQSCCSFARLLLHCFAAGLAACCSFAAELGVTLLCFRASLLSHCVCCWTRRLAALVMF